MTPIDQNQCSINENWINKLRDLDRYQTELGCFEAKDSQYVKIGYWLTSYFEQDTQVFMKVLSIRGEDKHKDK